MANSLVERLAEMIRLVACHSEGGLRRLVGDWPELTLDEWLELYDSVRERPDLGVRVDTSKVSEQAYDLVVAGERITEVLDKIGGWHEVVKATNLYRSDPNNAKDWNMFVSCVNAMKFPSRSRLKELPEFDRIQRDLGVDEKTIRARLDMVPEEIGKMAVEKVIQLFFVG